MKTSLQFVFVDGARHDLPHTIIDDAGLLPNVGDRVVLDDGSWFVTERYFDFFREDDSLKASDNAPVAVRMMLSKDAPELPLRK